MAGNKISVHARQAQSVLRKLFEELKAEREAGAEAGCIVDELEHYRTSSASDSDSDIVGLEAKLQDAKRSDEIEDAKRLKELYTKRLTKDVFYVSSQQLHAYLLDRSFGLFKAHVVPLIQGGADRAEIDAAVEMSVIDVIREELGESPWTLLPVNLRGMVFYLTGNCFIRWSAQ